MNNVRDQYYKRENRILQMTYIGLVPKASPAIRSYSCSLINSGSGPANPAKGDW